MATDIEKVSPISVGSYQALRDEPQIRKPRKEAKKLQRWLVCLGLLWVITQLVVQTKKALNYAYNISSTSSLDVQGEYLDFLDTTNLAGKWSKKYTSERHLAGEGLELVNFTEARFKDFGLSTKVETFDIYLNYPVDNGLRLLRSYNNDDGHLEVEFVASLKEDELENDPTTVGNDSVPVFHGYSASGNVTAEYVYVNYGTKEDFELLQSLGLSLEGKIAIARYGAIFRGLKVKFAQEAGCVGVLLYSDPGDDSFQEADGYKAYPDGPARNPSSVQRGSVHFLSQQPGDPTTPGYASDEGVPRVDPYHSIPKIPSLPVSFKDIEPILEKLNGHGIDLNGLDRKGSMIGSLSGFKYWTGPNADYKLNLYNEQSYDYRKCYNVLGEIKGKNPFAGYILIGNHRDAWIKGGASDPNSGSATLLEIIRSFHHLTKQGWVPERTIVFASWDGEEYALLGSTEHGEKHAKSLKQNCIAYLNVDVSVGGSKLNLAASPSLNKVLRESLKDVTYPGSEKSLFEHFYSDANKEIGILGSGSDYTVFLEHLGIPSADMGFENSEKDPVYHYHSNYDSYHWMSTMQDPGFKLHQAMAKYLGLVAIKLSDSKVLPLMFGEYATELRGYYQHLTANLPDGWLHRRLAGKSHCPKHKAEVDAPTVEDVISDTESALIGLIDAAFTADDKNQRLQFEWDNSDELPLWRRLLLDIKITAANIKAGHWERLFIVKEGLENRPWFKHMVYASGRDTGYEGFALPGLKESIEDEDFESFARWLKTIRHVVQKLLYSL